MNEITLLPILQKTYFKESPIMLFTSPLMSMYVGILLLLGALVGVYVRHHPPRFRFLHSSVSKHFAGKNLDLLGRVLRLLVGKLCIALAIFTSWNPVLFLIAGFCLYQVVSGWCIFFALTGRSSCMANSR